MDLYRSTSLPEMEISCLRMALHQVRSTNLLRRRPLLKQADDLLRKLGHGYNVVKGKEVYTERFWGSQCSPMMVRRMLPNMYVFGKRSPHLFIDPLQRQRRPR